MEGWRDGGEIERRRRVGGRDSEMGKQRERMEGRGEWMEVYSSVCSPLSSNVLERILLQNLNLSSFS